MSCIAEFLKQFLYKKKSKLRKNVIEKDDFFQALKSLEVR